MKLFPLQSLSHNAENLVEALSGTIYTGWKIISSVSSNTFGISFAKKLVHGRESQKKLD